MDTSIPSAPGDAPGFDPVFADLSPFGCWDAAPCYGGGLPGVDPLVEEARLAVLEMKSADPPPISAAEELRHLLNEMTTEMRGLFTTFRDLRLAAETLIESGDDTAGKLARADIKAATDAMSLIVRTLEKIDSLQRQLARDREDEAERAAEANGYGAAKQRFIQMIRDRADEKARRLYEEWKRHGPPDGGMPDGLSDLQKTSEPAHAEARAGEKGGQGDEGIVRHGPGYRDDCCDA